uniref:Uncharacterized protein n=1 Tax=Arundo donax TaxID=35708 RepID=A0A0A8YLH9_ARUDO
MFCKIPYRPVGTHIRGRVRTLHPEKGSK